MVQAVEQFVCRERGELNLSQPKRALYRNIKTGSYTILLTYGAGEWDVQLDTFARLP